MTTRSLSEIWDAWKRNEVQERWYDIPGYPIYEISDRRHVRVKSTKKIVEVFPGGSVYLRIDANAGNARVIPIKKLMRLAVPPEQHYTVGDELYRTIPTHPRYEMTKDGIIRSIQLKKYPTARVRKTDGRRFFKLWDPKTDKGTYCDLEALLEATWGKDA